MNIFASNLIDKINAAYWNCIKFSDKPDTV